MTRFYTPMQSRDVSSLAKTGIKDKDRSSNRNRGFVSLYLIMFRFILFCKLTTKVDLPAVSGLIKLHVTADKLPYQPNMAIVLDL